MADETQLDGWQLLAQVSQVYRTVSDGFVAQADISRAQAGLLCGLYEKDGLTQSEIAEQLAVQGATVTNMLQRMEETGLVIRRRDTEDNRLVRVYLTDAGRQKEREVNGLFNDLEAMIFEGISAEDRLVLRRMLHQILHNMSVAG